MTIRASKTDDRELTIVLDDTFDFNCVEEFRRAYESEDSARSGNYIIDFRNTQYMDSSALGMLINLQKYAQEGGGAVRLVNPNPQIRKIFAISRFDKKFAIE